jgi:hypothetical protein
MAKKPCRSCPTNKCSNCPVDTAAIEEAAIRSAANHGMPEEMWVPDPDTGETVYINVKNPSDKAVKLLDKLFWKEIK